ncbi:hypothetical protein [Streptomyces sp. NPDC126503]|uniref:hypothetical protein n=1 Tax=Streptomyces sp. NPDC126503 TaxID=3155315 RepID=UPI00332706AB
MQAQVEAGGGSRAGEHGVLVGLHLELMREAVAAGHGGDSYARIVEAFRAA